jgi:hypothetical protein
LGDDLKRTLTPGAKLRIAASCFSIHAYEALKTELEQIDSLEFIFTSACCRSPRGQSIKRCTGSRGRLGSTGAMRDARSQEPGLRR